MKPETSVVIPNIIGRVSLAVVENRRPGVGELRYGSPGSFAASLRHSDGKLRSELDGPDVTLAPMRAGREVTEDYRTTSLSLRVRLRRRYSSAGYRPEPRGLPSPLCGPASTANSTTSSAPSNSPPPISGWAGASPTPSTRSRQRSCFATVRTRRSRRNFEKRRRTRSPRGSDLSQRSDSVNAPGTSHRKRGAPLGMMRTIGSGRGDRPISGKGGKQTIALRPCSTQCSRTQVNAYALEADVLPPLPHGEAKYRRPASVCVPQNDGMGKTQAKDVPVQRVDPRASLFGQALIRYRRVPAKPSPPAGHP
ncbi:hypothetical protein HPGCJGGD_0274 [Methylobacterium haplocladii]|nr:hypothetical protein HPGCJGGD_0274 [Methylobacterium haplocladii]